MIARGKHIIKNHMTLEYQFSGIRIHTGYMVPVDWSLSVMLIATDKKGKTKEEIENRAGITYQKLHYWLDTNLPNIVMVDVGDETDLYIANLSANIMMYCPGAAGDDMIIRLLHSKLTALAHPELVVAEISLKGSDSSLQYTYDCEDGNYSLPLTTEEYYTEGKARNSEPWWTRNDGFCFEFIHPVDENGEDIVDESVFEGVIDPMDEFHKLFLEKTEDISIPKEPAKIVQVEKWKPKKVEE